MCPWQLGFAYTCGNRQRRLLEYGCFSALPPTGISGGLVFCCQVPRITSRLYSLAVLFPLFGEPYPTQTQSISCTKLFQLRTITRNNCYRYKKKQFHFVAKYHYALIYKVFRSPEIIHRIPEKEPRRQAKWRLSPSSSSWQPCMQQRHIPSPGNTMRLSPMMYS